MIRYLNFLLGSRTQWYRTWRELSPRCLFVVARNTHGTVHRSGDRTVPRSGHINVPRSGDRTVPRSGHINVPRSGDRTVPRSGHINVPRSGHITEHIKQHRTKNVNPNDSTEDKIILERNYDKIKYLKTQELRILSENCCKKNISDVIIWSEISKNAIEKCNDFKYFDAVLLLSSFDKMNIVDKSLYQNFADIFIKQINYLEPRHFIILINLYYNVNIFPRILFIEIFHGIIKFIYKLYPNEYIDLLLCFAKLNILNKELINILCKSIIKNINIFNYINLCCIIGSLRSLNIYDNIFYFIIDKKQQKELKLLTVQEIFDNLKNIKLLTFSWELYENDLLNEFFYRIDNFKNEIDVNQLDDPFICLNFLVIKNYVSKNFLLALSKWCANQVYEYPSRSTKRPLSFQLIKLYHLMKENKVENLHFIEKAIYRFVISRGGLETNRDKMFKPVSYQKGRKYIFTRDPLARTQDVFRERGTDSGTDMHSAKWGDIRRSDYLQNVGENLEQAETNITNAWESEIEYEDESSQDKFISGDYGVVRKISEKKRLVSLSLERKTEKKKDTHSNSRYCNFKLRQRPKRIKNGPAEVTISK
ncbi:conserved Plasmodium protein, unknown function [Plasmodium ovale curtisi]|uniref:Heptatricopeptide repeat-containing protein HPR1 n=1 Tax=Plasmodium ovale curtisi TaxID=864141 RepID=A0A1A8VPT8_PLAOA|nr:conserved Plasmodium protein, unknown function [Plasmodium ovale curtisi]